MKTVYAIMSPQGQLIRVFSSRQSFIEAYDKGECGQLSLGYKIVALTAEPKEQSVYDLLDIPF